jgi:hypothetical protein
VTYNNWPLYYYTPDSAPGDTKGQGLDQFGAKWYLVTPDGTSLEPSTATSPSGTPSGTPSSTPSNTPSGTP